MSIPYGYVDPSEMTAYQLIEPGEGTFKVVDAEEKISRNGNPMMAITFRITNMKGQSTLANEYIVSSNDAVQNKIAATKIYNLLSAIGRVDLYGLPLETKHVLHGRGKCIIKTHKSDDPKYSDKSVISQYISATVNAEPAMDNMDMDIPF